MLIKVPKVSLSSTVAWGVIMDIAQNLRKIRQDRRYTQEDIAEVLDMSQQQYSRYELGIHEIPVRHVVTLCKFYKISSDWLLGLTDSE